MHACDRMDTTPSVEIVSELPKAKVRFASSKPRESSSKRAGLVFPVRRSKRGLKKVEGKRAGIEAAVYVTAVIEYLVSEVLELAGQSCHDNGRKRLIPRDIKLAIGNDSELDALTKNSTIPWSGVVPNPRYFKSKKAEDEEKKAMKKKKDAPAAPASAPEMEHAVVAL